ELTMAGHEVEAILSTKDDDVFEMEITPNRPDCLNMLGVARETAAVLGAPRTFPKIKKRTWPRRGCHIEISDPQACSRYIATLIQDVKIQGSEAGMMKRLTAIGMRPINNVVDVTNFCLMETGQPMHAFDYDKLCGGKIIVRRARQGEKIVTIDGVERSLDPSILIIADAKQPVAIAGVMGGKNTEVTERTKNILLESAYFDPIIIRRASRKLGLSSDSSYRFERGVDDGTVQTGADRAIDLILRAAQGKIIGRSDMRTKSKKGPGRAIVVSQGWINARIGASLTAAKCLDILKKLDFGVTRGKKDILKIRPPSFRNDVKGAEDIVEEIARISGYDSLPGTFPQIKVSAISSDPVRRARQTIETLFLAQGFNQIITYTMISRKNLEMSGQERLPAVALINPLTQDQEVMRPSMLPGFLSVALSNVNKGQKNFRVFETGKIYGMGGEKETVGVMIVGRRTDDWRLEKKEEADFYDLKGVLEQMLARLQIDNSKVEFQPAETDFFEEGQSAAILINGKTAGVAGKLESGILDRWDIKQKNVLFAQVDMEEIFRRESSPRKYVPVQEFPAISRDISLAVPPTVLARDIEREIRQAINAQKDIVLMQTKFVEKYEGDKIPQGYRGMVFSLTYGARAARTLRDEEVAEVHKNVCATLIKKLGVVQR
ncbi:MAG TPA: phenylalanine--tRNA ligase subunit beta, partial [Candidatus Omnitrophota bacterium]|nr:phenylalanine--tRNA ligase subunit beta [Candidatus Omnitrophota bacterium]